MLLGFSSGFFCLFSRPEETLKPRGGAIEPRASSFGSVLVLLGPQMPLESAVQGRKSDPERIVSGHSEGEQCLAPSVALSFVDLVSFPAVRRTRSSR